jgi:hypothetical protein
MSRLSRTELKGIVKECLVEILSEGLAPSASSSKKLQENRQQTRRSPRQSRMQSLAGMSSGRQSSVSENSNRRSSYLDSISFGGNQQEQQAQERPPQRKPAVNTNITGDPILNELLADTAMSTLQEQASAERGRGIVTPAKGADKAAVIASQTAPEDLFGDEAAGKWATLAFS